MGLPHTATEGFLVIMKPAPSMAAASYSLAAIINPCLLLKRFFNATRDCYWCAGSNVVRK